MRAKFYEKFYFPHSLPYLIRRRKVFNVRKYTLHPSANTRISNTSWLNYKEGDYYSEQGDKGYSIQCLINLIRGLSTCSAITASYLHEPNSSVSNSGLPSVCCLVLESVSPCVPQDTLPLSLPLSILTSVSGLLTWQSWSTLNSSLQSWAFVL